MVKSNWEIIFINLVKYQFLFSVFGKFCWHQMLGNLCNCIIIFPSLFLVIFLADASILLLPIEATNVAFYLRGCVDFKSVNCEKKSSALESVFVCFN